MKKLVTFAWAFPLLCTLLAAPADAGSKKKALRTLKNASRPAAPAAASALTRNAAERALLDAASKALLEEMAVQELRHNMLLPANIRKRGTHLSASFLKHAINRATPGVETGTLLELETLQRKRAYYPRRLFDSFITRYYTFRFGQITPQLLRTVRSLGRQHANQREKLFFLRMQDLSQQTNHYLAHSDYLPMVRNVRLYYAGRPASDHFNARDLFYEYEIRPEAGQAVALRAHQNVSQIRLGGQNHAICGWQPNAQQITDFYKILLRLEKNEKPLVWLQKSDKKLIISNASKTRWIRVSAHETAQPKGLHIHLCWLDNVTAPRLPARTVLINNSIMLTAPPNSTPESLYRLLVSAPADALLKEYKLKARDAAEF